MTDVLQALQSQSAYDHAVGQIQLIETHLSWVFLTGDYAYKLKKPLRLPFVDFSTIERRAHSCREEIRLNRKFAPDLYLDTLPVVSQPDGSFCVSSMPLAEGCTLVDWVVKMRQFDTSSQGDELIAAGAVTTDQFFEFGVYLADIHKAAEVVDDAIEIQNSIAENFDTLGAIERIAKDWVRLKQLKVASLEHASRWEGLLLERQLNGHICECHGDLHLSNIRLRDDRLEAFDCIEFSRELRSIDVWNDVAFLVMDCCIRGRSDLAYSFVDGYLNVSGDYDGAILLNMFTQYRSMVRAKVAAISYDQSNGADQSVLQRMHRHIDWVEQRRRREPGRLVVCCGLSGSGKSYWSARLVPVLGAIRLRSDIIRKVSAGLSVSDNSASGIGSGLYDTDRSESLYGELTQLCCYLLQEGEDVIVDATCLTKKQRAQFLEAAERVDSKSVVLYLTAPDEVLKTRIVDRQRRNKDPSEATLEVLAWQQARQEVPSPPEPTLVADTTLVSLAEIETLLSEYFQA